jgi:hypothetical protein
MPKAGCSMFPRPSAPPGPGKRRVEAGQPALSGMFTRAEVTYAWPRPDGTVGSDREPVALFTGEAVHAYLGHLPDKTIEAMLNELSIELGAALGQERIYVAFADRTWILDAGERQLTRLKPLGAGRTEGEGTYVMEKSNPEK